MVPATVLLFQPSNGETAPVIFQIKYALETTPNAAAIVLETGCEVPCYESGWALVLLVQPKEVGEVPGQVGREITVQGDFASLRYREAEAPRGCPRLPTCKEERFTWVVMSELL